MVLGFAFHTPLNNKEFTFFNNRSLHSSTGNGFAPNEFLLFMSFDNLHDDQKAHFLCNNCMQRYFHLEIIFVLLRTVFLYFQLMWVAIWVCSWDVVFLLYWKF